MGFLDNSGDILLDAVLTDTGRYRLAKGDGSFRITKFAFGDDEIDYSLYDKTHASGSSHFDLTILQAPILEALTNNTSTMKSKLISIPRTNLLYLPILKLNEVRAQNSTARHSSGAYLVAVNAATETSYSTVQGVIPGESSNGGAYIRVDQGLDTTEIPPTFTIDADLVETQYIIEIDNRLGKIISVTRSAGGTLARVSFIDDDQIASYYLSLGTDPEFIQENTERQVLATETIAGPRGTFLQFQIQSSLELNTSNFLFSQLGSTVTIADKNGTNQTLNYIDSIVTVSGATTGYKLMIPIRYIKL